MALFGIGWGITWFGIVLVRHYVIENGHVDAQRPFGPIGNRRLPDVNWTTMFCSAAGIVAIWMFMCRVTVPAGLGVVRLDGTRALPTLSAIPFP
jgi:hypothetical protein